MIKHIVFSGGGSGGHVVPAITLIKKLQSQGFAISYIGSKQGIEKKLIQEQLIPYYEIATGKLRRYFSIQNFIDPFKIVFGVLQAFCLLFPLNRKQTLVFSTGGFVSVPVVVAARFLGFKVFIHEQTSRVGLANKIAGKFATKVFVSFEASKKFFKADKVDLSGYPVRDECFDSVIRSKMISKINLEDIKKPILFVTGGGNGSLLLNEAVLKEMKELKEKYFIFHQVGAQFVKDFEKHNDENYQSFGFLTDGMIDLYKSADLIISRAGAGTVCELIALGKASVFVPLKIAQFNEQWHNACEARDKLGSLLFTEDEFKNIKISELAIKKANVKSLNSNASKTIVEAIRNV
ncbi:MAG: UDP-N-acetylglucosamine--N-acetylmuramyl-(pentapeptide) pyrophosphoryl-undecaprenol N-acetylglucosamine transferase [Bdellovibrionales bacterium CG12_big_fil_rev_8_21_14_0_65_38_15]|nr:MAG: UDP-N-acetylglucosamine--N-acetylmuramyl-(pentapeptide) pyrophosphoryl-undecaprenol N-acetylglucosamine transferase [Bdellovibrionales bacterium CG22_combo_CG10-13_8_21_14_all_38_13]PIQ54494.1 MAG: UDP-N-acetylglucosamine--N-acetylmuramyl-(pentapeptide) pyrophosphoryl-undecaprenol N-acetylglucosamine transferase [Bdellovibrionales bacterium CG12_big_fil_rev_8_21_14_0_65_38_15]PIR29875.1 MAG: UDP-N-acetylglucosamine--N-acetylmuramyl-(pentapeptide) pyrophosphoryl-undecaprenol N-acetylglucos